MPTRSGDTNEITPAGGLPVLQNHEEMPSLVDADQDGEEGEAIIKTLVWKNIKVSRGNSTILQGASASAQKGKITAVMGHSGSGKTTLLKALAGKTRTCGGAIFLYGQQIDPTLLVNQRRIGFVADKDALDETQTILETVYFSARLRLPASQSDVDVAKLVHTIIQTLQLEKCANTRVANLSCGERRRLSIAIEMVIQPELVIMDEPTSGLDSYSAMILLSVCRDLANSGKTVLMSIHQPNRLMFNILDSVILLKRGGCVYSGQADKIQDFLSSKSVNLAQDENPADALVTWSSTTTAEGLIDEDSSWINILCARASKDGTSAGTGEQDGTRQHDRIALHQELGLLLQREWRHMRRATTVFCSRMGIALGGSILIALVFFGVAKNENETPSQFYSHAGALFFALLSTTVVIPGVMFEFVDERPIFERAYKTGHFRLISYALSKAASEIVFVVLQILVLMGITYGTIGFQADFWLLFAIVVTFAWSVASMAVCVAAIARNPDVAKELPALVVFPQSLLCGFFVAVGDLPNWIVWATYLGPLTYAFRLSLVEEFSYCAVPAGDDFQVIHCLETVANMLGRPEEDLRSYDQNSVLTLAQTGIFKGPEAVAEFVDIFHRAIGNESCYFGDLEVEVHESSDTTCDVSFASASRANAGGLFGGVGDGFLFMFGEHLVINLNDDSEDIIAERHLQIANPNENGLAQMALEPDSFVGEICQALQDYCPSELFHFASFEDCEASMAQLPISQVDDFGHYTLKGNSSGCQYIHVGLAKVRPDIHCSHISWNADADTNGNKKCHDDMLKRSFHNFSQQEHDLFQRVAVDNGITDTSMVKPFWNNRSDSPPPPRCRSPAETNEQVAAELAKLGTFEDFDPLCKAYLDIQKATPDMASTYWASLFGLVAFFRLTTLWTLHHHAVNPE